MQPAVTSTEAMKSLQSRSSLDNATLRLLETDGKMDDPLIHHLYKRLFGALFRGVQAIFSALLANES